MSVTAFQYFVDLVGALAAMLTTAALVPQAWLTWKTRRADDVSFGMYSMFTTGVALWLVYGLMVGAWTVIIANGLTLVVALFILSMKLRFGRRRR